MKVELVVGGGNNDGEAVAGDGGTGGEASDSSR